MSKMIELSALIGPPPAAGHGGGVGDALKFFRRKPRAVQIQIAVAPDAGFFHRRDAGLQAGLRRREGIADFFPFVVALLLTPVKKRVALHVERKAARP